jgi:ComF family protein
MIHRIKYGGSLVDARVLASLLADRVATEYAEGDIPGLITPIPLSWRRLARRGHNQAALIARYVGQRLNIRVHYDVLRRTRHTPPQAQLSRSARRANLSQAFRLRGALPAPRITLIDDVLTTGATLRAATRTLKAAGAAEVHIWVLARTHA